MIGDVKPKSQSEKRMDAMESGSGGVGEFINAAENSERFNDYTNNTGTGDYNHIEGTHNTVTDGTACHAGGRNNTMSKAVATLACGTHNTVTPGTSTYGGEDNFVSGSYNTLTISGQDFVTGMLNSVTNSFDCIVCGYQNTVIDAHDSIVTGSNNTNSGALRSITCGSGNTNSAQDSIMCGSGGSNSRYPIAVGHGTSSNPALSFYVTTNGLVYASAYNTIGADYAEYFEWSDGNPENEDRRGMLVSLNGDRITLAHGDDILGAVSSTPSVIGNSADEHWQGKYKRDIFGNEILDENGERQLSDDYDRDRAYIPRSQRPEWAAIGMFGRLIVCDNGKCMPNGYVSARNGIGVPTLTKTNVRCLKRLDDSHIEVLVR